MTYRERILEYGMEKWPVPVPAQLLRARLAAFKADMADCKFRLEACACCARGKRPVKLRKVGFPPPDVAKPPAWLPCSDEEWAKAGAANTFLKTPKEVPRSNKDTRTTFQRALQVPLKHPDGGSR